MKTTHYSPHCPVCGHDGYRSLKQNSPAKEFLPADLIVSRTTTRQCDNCKTTFVPARESSR